MTSRAEKEKAKLVQDKCQEILSDLLRDDDNKYCVDCDAKGPRWASWNLGIFLCIRCAGIHRNLGVHISKVKSINLDSWTPEQVGSIQQMGNSKARAVFEANLPDGHRRPQTDSALEAFIRSKYEQRKYIAREWVAPPVTPAFDIEEEVKKDKEKRRQINKPTGAGIRGPTSSASIISDQNNSVPRPVSTHPASTTISAEKVPKDSPTSPLSGSKSNNDLLGINFADSTSLVNMSVNDQSLKGNTGSASDGDLFASAFDSKPKSTKDEESDFFNQKAPDMSKKLDTNSILKLYESSNTATNFFNPIPAMTQQTSLNQQLPFGLQPSNPIPASVQPQPFGASFTQTPLVPGLMSQPLISTGIFPSVNQTNSVPSSQALPFGAPAAAATNPFLSSPAPTNPNMSGFSVNQPTTTLNQTTNQLGSLQLDTKLINNWLGTSLPSTAPSFPSVPVAPSSDLFGGLNGGLNKFSSNVEPTTVAPVTSANPFVSPALSTTTSNGSFGDSNFAAFPASFPNVSAAPITATTLLSSQNQPDFGNLSWANFNQAPAIATGGPSVPPSVLPPSSDLWQ